MSYADFIENATRAQRQANAENVVVFKNALKLIIEVCGTVNYSSPKQMKEAVEAALEIAELALNKEK